MTSIKQSAFLQGILSSVYMDGRILHQWKLLSVPLNNLNKIPSANPIFQVAYSELTKTSARRKARGGECLSVLKKNDKKQNQENALLYSLIYFL